MKSEFNNGGFSDSERIQSAIDGAGKNGTVTLSVNPRTGDSVWEIDKAIKLPSDITVYVKDATLRLKDGVFCNIFTTENSYSDKNTVADEVKNIKIIGQGKAVLDGGNFNGYTERNLPEGNAYYGNRPNCFMFFNNLNGFEIRNLTVKDFRYWALTFVYSRNGKISDITFDGKNNAPNQDGIDLRAGCNNIEIENIYGCTGDDTVALTALIGDSKKYAVSGKENDIRDVVIKNVKTWCSGGHGIIRLLAQDGLKVYGVKIQNVYDLTLDNGEKGAYGVLRIGDTHYFDIKENVEGDIDKIVVDGVISGSDCAVLVGSPNVKKKHLTCTNINAVKGKKYGAFWADEN